MLDRRELRITCERNEDEDDVAVIMPEFNISEKVEIAFDSQKLATTPLVICLPGPLPY
ncbi:hypothetical protein A2U01_0116785, partial [Trifolium medium]|nr:hypothetical protein [Trifolium medium]